MLGNDISLVIAGNKMDLERDRKVSAETAEQYAASVGARHFYTSAKLNRGIEEMVLDLTKRMIQERDRRGGSGAGFVQRQRSTIIIDDDAGRPPAAGGGGCCS